MSESIEAIYEGGVFKPLSPVALSEHQQVRITIEPAPEDPRQALIERLRALGHLQGQPIHLSDAEARLLTYDELQRMLPRLDPPLSKQILDDRR
jgi:predicted DNA-binding antitoxin AbrB/MazE fold protein